MSCYYTSRDTTSTSSDSDENSEKLDPLSPIFDPRRALYAKTVKVPDPNARLFNNIAEFENYLKGRDSKTLNQNKKEKEKRPGIVAERAAAQARENVRKAAILAKYDGPSKKSQTQMRRSRTTTVFTKIEGFKGPLSLLRKCMEDKLKVLVVIRAAVTVRSHCKGYVIAFDKHFNMALMDVDEIYLRTCKKDEDKTQIDSETSFKKEFAEPFPVADRVTKSRGSQDSETKCTESIVKEKLSQIFHGLSGDQKGLSEIYREKCNIKVEDGARKKTDMETEKNKSSSAPINNANKTDSAVDNSCVSASKRTTGETSWLKQESVFWDLYKPWAEKRCLTKFEVLERHVNQLFIRGDNIVSVSVAQ